MPVVFRCVCRPLVSLLFIPLLNTTTAAQSRKTPATSAQGDNKGGAVIPFTYDPLLTPAPVIQVKVNGKKPLPFIVDTGLSIPLVVDEWAAKQLGLEPSGQTTILSPGDVKVALTKPCRVVFSVAENDKDSIFAPGFDLEAAGIADLHILSDYYAGPRIAGAIGTPLLERFSARLDFAAKTMSLFFLRRPPTRDNQVANLPMREHEKGCYYVTLTPDKSTPVELQVDTGSTYTRIPAALAARLGSVAASTVGHSGFAGNRTLDYLLLPTFQIGPFTEPNVAVTTDDNSPYGLVLGMDILSRFRVILDFPNGLMVLERATDYSQRLRLPGSTDLLLARRDGHYYVKEIVPGSPPDQAQVHQGDRVVQVDGHRLDDLPVSVVQHLVKGFADSKAELIVERADGQKVHVNYLRKSQFTTTGPPPRIGIGISTETTADGRWILAEVSNGSPAQEAGLRAGDEIIEINGLPTAKMTLEQFAAQAKKPEGEEVILKVQRKGEEKPREVRLKVRKLL